MNRIMLSIAFTLIVSYGSAQSTDTQEATQHAHKIAKRMQDSLGLSPNQRHEILLVNLGLNEQKMAARQSYSGDSLRMRLQFIENQRDSLYRPILTEPIFLQYKERKRSLVNNN